MKKIISFPEQLTAEELIDKILAWKLRDANGLLEYQDAKELAGHAKTWKLQKVSLKAIGVRTIADPKFPNRSKKYPVILLTDSKDAETWYEILDGIHRLSMANANGDEDILAYVGDIADFY